MKGVIYILGITPLLEVMKEKIKENMGVKEGMFYDIFSVFASIKKAATI